MVFWQYEMGGQQRDKIEIGLDVIKRKKNTKKMS